MSPPCVSTIARARSRSFAVALCRRRRRTVNALRLYTSQPATASERRPSSTSIPFKRFNATAATSNTSAPYQAVRRPRRTPIASTASNSANAVADARAVVDTTSGTTSRRISARPRSGRVSADSRFISAAHHSATPAKRRVRCVQSIAVGSADHDARPYGSAATVGGITGNTVVASGQDRLDPRLVEHRRATHHEPHLQVVRRLQLHPRQLAHVAVHRQPDPARATHHQLVAAPSVGDEPAPPELGELRQVRGTAHEPAVAGRAQTGAVGTQTVLDRSASPRHDGARGAPRLQPDPCEQRDTCRHEQSSPRQRELCCEAVGVGHREHRLGDERGHDERQPHAEQPAGEPARAVEVDELLGVIDVVTAGEPAREAPRGVSRDLALVGGAARVDRQRRAHGRGRRVRGRRVRRQLVRRR